VSMGTSFVAIERNPSPALREYHDGLSVLAERTSEEVVAFGFVFSVAVFTISAKHLYTIHGTSGAVVVLGAGLIMIMESWMNVTGMTPTEKCLVFLPWVVSMGMAGLVLFRRPVSSLIEIPNLAVPEKQPA